MPQRYNRNRMYGRGYRQYDPTYQAAGFNPAVFEGSSVDFNPHDFSIYERGLANLQARMDKAAEEQGAVDLTLAEIETKLNPAEREWFSSYKHDIKNQIQSEIDAGNFGSAIRKATKLGKQAASDSRIIGRIEANSKYQQALKEVLGNNNLSKDTKDWWIATHQYSYEDKYDASGNPIAGDIKEYNDRPVGPVDLTKIAATSIQLVAPDKTFSKGSTTNYGGIGTTKSNGQPLVSSGHDNNTVELSEEKLKETFDAVFANNPEAKAYLTQEREVAMWKLRQLEDLKNTTDDEAQKQLYEEQQKLYKNELYGDDGHFMSETEYIAKRVSPILHNAAYKYVDNSYNSVYGSSNSGVGGALVDVKGLPVGFTLGRTSYGGVVNLDYSNAGTTAVRNVGTAAQNSKKILSGLQVKPTTLGLSVTY